jgi:hypothetical protein
VSEALSIGELQRERSQQLRAAPPTLGPAVRFRVTLASWCAAGEGARRGLERGDTSC